VTDGKRGLDPITIGDGQVRFPTLWHLCWFLQNALPGTTNDDTVFLAGVIRGACVMVGNPSIADVKCGLIPSPLSLEQRWILFQWRSIDGYNNRPPNSIIVNFHRGLWTWISDAWIPGPNEPPGSAFVEESSSQSDQPIFNTHVRELACLLALDLLTNNMVREELDMPKQEQNWWKLYRRNRPCCLFQSLGSVDGKERYTPSLTYNKDLTSRVKTILGTIVLYKALFDRYEERYFTKSDSAYKSLPRSRVIWPRSYAVIDNYLRLFPSLIPTD
jgi:hypothetical protein